MDTVSTEELISKLIDGYCLIDVRAPIEFNQGAVPNSVNIPILDDKERAEVGSCYKKIGKEKAIELGYNIVSGANKDKKLKAWTSFIEKNPKVILTCFRGGLRSRKSQEFLSEIGINLPRVKEGYKAVRFYLIGQIENYCQKENLKLLTGFTGSGKTNFLNGVSHFYPVVDLEGLANHRGSAFGLMEQAQPAQASFENNMAFEILKIKKKSNQKPPPFLFEDESRLIGSVHLPEIFFNKLRSSPVIRMQVSLENRIENIYSDYIKPDISIFDKYEKATYKIEKRLGGARTQELLTDINNSRRLFLDNGNLDSNKIWIEKLLVWYYDPMYLYSFNKRNPDIEFEGSHEEIREYLKQKSN